MLDSSTPCFVIPTHPTFLSLLQKLANFKFLSCTLTLITRNGVLLRSSSVEQAALFSPDHGVPATHFTFYTKISKLCKTVIFILYFYNF